MDFIITSILVANAIMYAVYVMETDDRSEQFGSILLFIMYMFMALCVVENGL